MINAFALGTLLRGPLAVFLYWATYMRDHQYTRDWPDILGIYPISPWIVELEGRIACWERDGRKIRQLYARNQPGIPFPGTQA